MLGKSIGTMLMVMLASWILAACGGEEGLSGGTANDSPQKVKAVNTEAAVNHDPITLTFTQTVTSYTADQFMEYFGDAIQKKFPYITAKYNEVSKMSFVNQIAAGEDLDIIFSSIGTIAPIFKSQAQWDMGELIKKNNFNLSRFEPATIGMMKQFGGMYGLPVDNTQFVFLYNRDLFDKFGVPYPKDGMTWDEAYDIAKKMTREDGGVQYRGFGASFSHWAITNQLSAMDVDPKTGKSTYASDNRWKTFVQNIVRFYQIPGNGVDEKTVGLAPQQNAFKKDKTEAIWLQAGIPREGVDVNWDMVSLPTFKELPGIGSQPYPVYWFITSMSKHKDDAFQIISFLTSDDYQKELSKRGLVTPLNSPEVQKAFGEDAAYLKGKNIQAVFKNKLASAPAMNIDSYVDTSYAKAKLVEHINNVAVGSEDINTALSRAAEEADKAIAEAKAK